MPLTLLLVSFYKHVSMWKSPGQGNTVIKAVWKQFFGCLGQVVVEIGRGGEVQWLVVLSRWTSLQVLMPPRLILFCVLGYSTAGQIKPDLGSTHTSVCRSLLRITSNKKQNIHLSLRMPSSGIWRRAGLVRTDVAEERIAYIIWWQEFSFFAGAIQRNVPEDGIFQGWFPSHLVYVVYSISKECVCRINIYTYHDIRTDNLAVMYTSLLWKQNEDICGSIWMQNRIYMSVGPMQTKFKMSQNFTMYLLTTDINITESCFRIDCNDVT
jgi:hypothetical protein